MSSREYDDTPFDFVNESEPVGRALDCLGPRQTAGPFHYLINEQAKSLLALQELQHEVGALLEFRDLVIETFPSLKTKLSSPSPPASHNINTGQAIARTEWVPGIRVRRKLGAKKNDPVPDSGFSTETSSKEAHSASSAMVTTSAGSTNYDTDDELWSLLDVIHRKGTRLKDEVEALHGHLQISHRQSPQSEDFQESLYRTSGEDVRQIRRERDSLMGRLAEMEAEVVSSRIQTSRLQEDFEQLLTAKQDLEQQLRNVLNQRGEVNSRIHDLHLQFVAKNEAGGGQQTSSSSSNVLEIGKSRTLVSEAVEVDKINKLTIVERNSSHENLRTSCATASAATTTVISEGLDKVLGDRIPKVNVTDSKKFTAILSEQNPLVLKKHLLSSTVQNEILMKQLENASRLEVNLVDKLDKFREENEDLRFQLKDKDIELEGTRARVRMLEQLQKSPNSHSNPDVIPTSTLSSAPSSRGELLSESMKNMSPIAMTLQVDHSSSTESAHDQMENNNRKFTESAKLRKPSRIPLKSYTAPKPPGRGKNSQNQQQQPHGARSRSGDSPGRLHSSHSSRGGCKSENGSLHGSVTSKDSLSSKLRGSDSLSRFSSTTSGAQQSLRKNSSPIAKWANGSGASSNNYNSNMNNNNGSSNISNGKEQISSNVDKDSLSPESLEKSQYRWSLCLFERDQQNYPDSLDSGMDFITNREPNELARKFLISPTTTTKKNGSKKSN